MEKLDLAHPVDVFFRRESATSSLHDQYLGTLVTHPVHRMAPMLLDQVVLKRFESRPAVHPNSSVFKMHFKPSNAHSNMKVALKINVQHLSNFTLTSYGIRNIWYCRRKKWWPFRSIYLPTPRKKGVLFPYFRYLCLITFTLLLEQ